MPKIVWATYGSILIVIIVLASVVIKAQANNDCVFNRANEFAQAYNRFAEKMNNGIFDMKDAQAVSNRFERLESCGMWPKR